MCKNVCLKVTVVFLNAVFTFDAYFFFLAEFKLNYSTNPVFLPQIYVFGRSGQDKKVPLRACMCQFALLQPPLIETHAA